MTRFVASLFAVALAGVAVAQSPVDDRLLLRRGAFDPVREAPPPSPAALGSGAEGRLWIVQHRGAKSAASLTALRAAGASPVAHVPKRADVVEVDPTRLAEVRALPFVRAVVPYAPADRIDPSELFGRLAARDDAGAWNVLVVRAHDPELKRRVVEDLRPLGGRPVFDPAASGSLIVMELPGPSFVAALGHDGVLFMDRRTPASPDMDVVRQVFGATALAAASPAGFTGAGVRPQSLDFGPRLTHVDFAPILWHGETAPPTAHGTATAGILFGRGVADPAATGMLPDSVPLGGYALGAAVAADRYGYTAALTLPPFEATLQSNSWGTTTTTAYGTASFVLDQIVFELGLLVFQSQGNSGSNASRSEAWAKNVVSVGGVFHYDTPSLGDDAWANGASFGPAADGRRKPDLVGFFDQIRTTTNTSDTAYVSNFTGTSAATPMVAGAGGLMQEMWTRGVFGPTPFGPSFRSKIPRAETTKALLVNTATPYPFSGVAGDLARVRQGWGLPDVAKAYALGDSGRRLVVDATVPLGTGETFVRTISVQAGEPEFRATLVYVDPPGAPSASEHRVNDLDLEVVAPDGTIYRGNVGLDVGTWSAPGGAADDKDPVENVFILAPAAGVWTVRVVATEINQDAFLRTTALDAAFALAATGGVVVGAPFDSGQSNGAASWLLVNEGLGLHGGAPGDGVAGPFFASATPGGPLAFVAGGAPMSPFLLAFGPLNRGNALFPGIGSLDLGFGGGDVSDVVPILNGLFPTTLLDAMATTGPTGARVLSFTVPALPAGVLGAFQTATSTPGGSVILGAAFEVAIR